MAASAVYPPSSPLEQQPSLQQASPQQPPPQEPPPQDPASQQTSLQQSPPQQASPQGPLPQQPPPRQTSPQEPLLHASNDPPTQQAYLQHTCPPEYKEAPPASYVAHPTVPSSQAEQSVKKDRYIIPHALQRCSSMPTAIDTTGGSVMVRLRLPSVNSRSRQHAQYLRNSVAVTSSDYYNALRPQMLRVHKPLRPTSALEAISENEIATTFQSPCRPISLTDDNPGPTFRYTPTPILDPARQTVPTPLSRPTTPQFPMSHPSTLQVVDSQTQLGASGSLYHASSSRCSTPQAIPFNATIENQFLPMFVNPQSGSVYTYEDGYYIPLPPKHVQIFQESAKVQPPAPDRRTDASLRPHGQQTHPPPSDYIWFVQLLMILYLLCFDIFVIAACSVPALICAQMVQKDNREKRYKDAKKHSEYVVCFNITGVILHVLLVLAVIATALILHFVFDVFS